MECKTIAPMVVAGKNLTGQDAHEYSKHVGQDGNCRTTQRWAKRQAHAADRRASRMALADWLDDVQNDDDDDEPLAYNVDPLESLEAAMDDRDHEEVFRHGGNLDDYYYSLKGTQRREALYALQAELDEGFYTGNYSVAVVEFLKFKLPY